MLQEEMEKEQVQGNAKGNRLKKFVENNILTTDLSVPQLISSKSQKISIQPFHAKNQVAGAMNI